MSFFYSAAGNTFIFVTEPVSEERICALCTHHSVDGLIFLEGSSEADFKMYYYNSDGSSAKLCGNGLRASKAFLKELGFHKKSYEIFLGGVTYLVEDVSDNLYKVHYPYPSLSSYQEFLFKNQRHYFLDVANPHLISFVSDIEHIDVFHEGRLLRYSEELAPNGANISFIELFSPHFGKIRTYEKGVENETGACGSGCLAAFLIGNRLGSIASSCTLITRSNTELSHTLSIPNVVEQTGPAEKLNKVFAK